MQPYGVELHFPMQWHYANWDLDLKTTGWPWDVHCLQLNGWVALMKSPFPWSFVGANLILQNALHLLQHASSSSPRFSSVDWLPDPARVFWTVSVGTNLLMAQFFGANSGHQNWDPIFQKLSRKTSLVPLSSPIHEFISHHQFVRVIIHYHYVISNSQWCCGHITSLGLKKKTPLLSKRLQGSSRLLLLLCWTLSQ